MNLGFRFWKLEFHCNGTKDELAPLVVPCIWIAFTLLHGCFTCTTLFRKGSRRNQVNTDKKEGGIKQSIMAEPVVRKASEIPTVGSDLDIHQLAGKLLYREDICICYGEEHSGKTSILLSMVIDIVLQKKSHIMKDDCGVHPSYHCIWYNGEMNDADFDVFFGDFDRKILDGKIDFVDGFTHFSITEWFTDVKSRLSDCTCDTVVVLDNLSTISNVSDKDINMLFNNIKAIQAEMRQKGIYATFIILGHINKSGDSKGPYNLKALGSNRIRFSSNGKNHTKITVEKNRKYQDMRDKSFNLRWTTSSEGFKSYENLGEIVNSDTSSPQDSNDETFSIDEFCGREKKYSDEEIMKFHKYLEETGSKSEATRQSGVPRQTYDRRIGKLIEKGKCQPIPDQPVPKKEKDNNG